MGEKNKKCPMCSRKLVDRNGIPTCPDCGYRDPQSAKAAQPQYSGESRLNVPKEPVKTQKSVMVPKRRILVAVWSVIAMVAVGVVVGLAQSELKDKLVSLFEDIVDGKDDETPGGEDRKPDGDRDKEVADLEKEDGETGSSEAEEQEPAHRRPESDFLISLLERVYAKPIEEVSYEEICGIACLDFYYLDGTDQGVQALDVWLSDGSWKSYLLDRPDVDTGDFACLEGLEQLYLLESYSHVGIRTDWHDLKQLQYLSCNVTMEELTKCMDVSQLVYLETRDAFGMKDLSVASAYTNLECLILDSRSLSEIKGLSQAPSLKALYIKSGDGISDFSELYKMPQLEQLSICSSGLKDISFVSGMEQLQYLELEKTKVKDVSALADCADTLTALYLTEDHEIADISPVMACTGLEALQLWVGSPLGDVPDFSAMENLQFLSIVGYEKFDNLASLTGLTELTLNRAHPGENGLPLASLPNLKTLNLINTSLYGSTVEELVDGLDQLEVLNLKDSFLWSDISPVFGLANLTELNLEGVQCGLVPERLTVCENLTVLNVTRTVFHSLTEEGGWDYGNDDTALSTQEVLDAAAPCMPMLNTLLAPRQELDDLTFTANLPELWMLDVAGNYVKDLSPLTELEWLSLLRCSDNPVQSKDGLEDVMVY